jgi:hypothetical protein
MFLDSYKSIANPSVVYVHIGDTLPEYLFDSIYQTLLINKNTCKIYVIINQSNIEYFIKTVSNFNLNTYFSSSFDWLQYIEPISIESLQELLQHDNFYQSYLNTISSKYNSIGNFRDGFWISTTSRFFYINCFMKKYNIHHLFHIENDIMMYESFSNIFHVFFSHTNYNNIWVVQDSPDRVVPSILYFPHSESLSQLTSFISQEHIQSNAFINDMNLLGKYNNKFTLPISPDQWSLIFDGAAIGQYLGGIDIRNTENNHKLSYYINNTIGFINETSIFKPNSCNFSYSTIQTDIHSVPLKLLICNKISSKQISSVSNIHIHSKQLYQFSSIMDLKYNDIITGDRVISLCDFVITTHGIYSYHKNIEKYANDIILVKDWQNVNIIKLNNYFKQLSIIKKSKNIILFIYTHTLQLFNTYILKHLEPSLNYIIYTHNSDHEFNLSFKELVDTPYIKHVYAQNLEYDYNDINSNKLTLLPIGLANSMWPHGDLYSFYTTIKNTYMFNKSFNLYVNINPSTFSYRKTILDKINTIANCTWKIAKSKPYSEYLMDLANHKFCLCIRGNGIDTHRFWESLYLGTIPVIINNQYTNCNNFVIQLKNLNIPFVEITQNNIDDIIINYPDSHFSNELYLSIMQNSNSSIFNNPCLKLSYYKYIE